MIDGTSALQPEYIDNVPWEKSPAFTYSDNSEAYLEAFKNAIDYIPTKDLKISFSDDIWDFQPYFASAQRKCIKFIFTDLPEDLKVYCKFFVLHKIQGKTKISTTYVRLSQFISIITNIIKRTNHKSIDVITNDDINSEIKRRNAAPSTIHNLYQAAYQVYYFLIKYYHLCLPIDHKDLNNESVKWKKIEKQSSDESKIPDIPEEYFNKILNKSLEVMRNQQADTNERMVASAIVFISQTGLRIGDFLVIKTDGLHSKTLAKSGNTTNYVHFTARKPSKAHQPLLEFDIFCNNWAAEAFNTMKSLRSKSPLSNGNQILFVLNDRKKQTTTLPHSDTRFRYEYRKFLYANLPVESTRKWEGIEPFTYHLSPHKEKNGTAEPIQLYIPDTRQYRVHLCTELYNKGVPMVYIQKFMGHLSESMMGYYVRPKDTYQENIEYSEKVIREIAGEEDVPPLGGNLLGKDIKENIKQFIEDNGFNVETDIEAIVKALGDKVIIRGKTGGVCIKTSLMPCSKDARTNEMMCAYNLCPNLFHFYYMVDISYLDFHTLQDTYKTMKKEGKTKAAQKELSKMRDLLNRRLIPEMDELDREIEAKGFDQILDKHPLLLEIMTNREEIRKEIEEWRTKR